jgi:hypothetical protein
MRKKKMLSYSCTPSHWEDYVLQALSLVVTQRAEATPTACVHRRRISFLDDLDRPLDLVGKIFYPLF